jgi:cytochrome c553
MQAFAAGRRAGLLMQQIAKGYDARMIRAIAQWYAQRVPEEP